MILLQASNLSPQNFFTPGSFTTLAGATGIVYIVCGAIQQAFNYSPKWLALVISMIISFIAAYIGNTMAQPKMEIGILYLLAILNGFLIYMTATGTNQIIAPNPTTPGPPAPPAHPGSQRPELVKKRKFRSNWWHHE
jgi:hypothetical protein